MARIHLFEVADQSWCPAVVRRWMMDLLQTAYTTIPLPTEWPALIAKAAHAGGTKRVIDLGSGYGGPVLLLAEEICNAVGPGTEIVLTDLKPAPQIVSCINRSGLVTYREQPVNASEPPSDEPGIWTILNAMHHLKPDQARALLKRAYDQRRPIAVFETTSKTIRGAFGACFIPFFVWLVTLRIRPISFFRLFFTYVLPVLPLLIGWDGFVSHMRTYSAVEMDRLTQDLRGDDYDWESGSLRMRFVPYRIPYLLGLPKSQG